MGLFNIDLKEGLTPKNIVWIVLVIAGAWLFMEIQSRSMNMAARGKTVAELGREINVNLMQMREADVNMANNYAEGYGSAPQHNGVAFNVKALGDFYSEGYKSFTFSESNKAKFERLKNTFLKYGMLPGGFTRTSNQAEYMELLNAYQEFYSMLQGAMEHGRNFAY